MARTNKIGVVVDCFGSDLHSNLAMAAKAGVDGVQIYAKQRDVDLGRSSPQEQRELFLRIQSLGLEVSAICAEFGRDGLRDPERNPELIEDAKRATELALRMGCNIITTHIGAIPADRSSAIHQAMLSACEELGDFARANKACFAIETGPETAQALKEFLDILRTDAVAVNYDPANLIMAMGDDPVQGVYTLRDHIVHTHVKDGLHRAKEAFVIQEGETTRLSRETPMGEGDVPFDAYFAALREIGFGGYLTIERETGNQREKEIGQAVALIRRYNQRSDAPPSPDAEP